MFTLLLYHLRHQGILVGTHEWLTFLKGVHKGLAYNLDSLYQLGRTTLCKTEAEFDAFDQGFLEAFEGVEIAEVLFEQMIHQQLQQWLENAQRAEGELVEPDIPIDKLMEELEKKFRSKLNDMMEEVVGLELEGALPLDIRVVPLTGFEWEDSPKIVRQLL